LSLLAGPSGFVQIGRPQLVGFLTVLKVLLPDQQKPVGIRLIEKFNPSPMQDVWPTTIRNSLIIKLRHLPTDELGLRCAALRSAWLNKVVHFADKAVQFKL
jgi:hypothetical protein